MMEWINSEQGITVLRAAVLILLLVWLLSGGFSFLDRWIERWRRRRKDDD